MKARGKRASWVTAGAAVAAVVVGMAGLTERAEANESSTRLVRRADELFEAGRRDNKVEGAVEAYEKAIALDDQCQEAYWKLARAIYVQGEDINDSEKAASLYREGIEYAKMGVELDPASALIDGGSEYLLDYDDGTTSDLNWERGPLGDYADVTTGALALVKDTYSCP